MQPAAMQPASQNQRQKRDQAQGHAQTAIDWFESPVGWLQMTASALGITSLRFEAPTAAASAHTNPHTAQCGQELRGYFAGRDTPFTVALDLRSASEYQRQVWQALRTIPYGCTRAYVDIAERLGNPRSARAVGAATGRNPIAIIIPCHRVIGIKGDLTGYNAGLERKHWLLQHEGALLL